MIRFISTHVNPWLIHVNVWQKTQQIKKKKKAKIITLERKERFRDSKALNEPSDQQLVEGTGQQTSQKKKKFKILTVNDVAPNK